MEHSCKKCSPRCVYFPNSYEEITKEYVDDNGLKHRDGILRCEYDSHKIRKFEMCSNYLDVTRA